MWVIDMIRVLYNIAIGVEGLVRLAGCLANIFDGIFYSYQGRLALES